jgi:hypothetical protein
MLLNEQAPCSEKLHKVASAPKRQTNHKSSLSDYLTSFASMTPKSIPGYLLISAR